MGIGDYIIWSAVVREAVEQLGVDVVKIVKWKLDKKTSKPKAHHNYVDHFMFKNNPRIVRNVPKGKKAKVIDFGLCGPTPFNYVMGTGPEKWNIPENYVHAVTQICRKYNICKNPKSLRGEIVFDRREREKVEELMLEKGLKGRRFIVIEPHSKKDELEGGDFAMVPFEKYQEMVDALGKQIIFVQTGVSGKRVLNGVINLTGKLGVREAICLIGYARGVVCPEGGVMHMAHLMGVPAVVLLTGFLDPKLTCYERDRVIWIGEKHGPCNLVKCEQCWAEVREFDSGNLIKEVEKLLGNDI